MKVKGSEATASAECCCTSTAGRVGVAVRPAMRASAAAALLSGVAMSLSGCDVPRVEGYFDIVDMRIATHSVAIWRTKDNYWNKFAYTDPMTNVPSFNSCMDPRIDSMSVCNARGTCTPFIRTDVVNPVFFCQCDAEYGDPECGTRRKRQSVAWLLSMLVGFLGADQWYLGWWAAAILKLHASLLGMLIFHVFNFPYVGTTVVLIWWLVDVVRIGSTDVRSYEFRVNSDLPHWAFAVFTLIFFAIIGFILGVSSVYFQIVERRQRQDTGGGYGSVKSLRGGDPRITI